MNSLFRKATSLMGSLCILSVLFIIWSCGKSDSDSTTAVEAASDDTTVSAAEVVVEQNAALSNFPHLLWSFCDNSIKLIRVDSQEPLDGLQKSVWQFLSRL